MTAFTLPHGWLEELRDAARDEGISMSEILRQALRTRLNRTEADRLGRDLESEEAAPQAASENTAPHGNSYGSLHKAGA
jgi:hypothetical protein